jgi:hypothetical protein
MIYRYTKAAPNLEAIDQAIKASTIADTYIGLRWDESCVTNLVSHCSLSCLQPCINTLTIEFSSSINKETLDSIVAA